MCNWAVAARIFSHYQKNSKEGNVYGGGGPANLFFLYGFHSHSHACSLFDCNIGVAKLAMAKQLAKSVLGLEISCISKVGLFPQRNRVVVFDTATANLGLLPFWMSMNSRRRRFFLATFLSSWLLLLQLYYMLLLLCIMVIVSSLLPGMIVIMNYMLLLLVCLHTMLIVILMRKFLLLFPIPFLLLLR